LYYHKILPLLVRALVSPDSTALQGDGRAGAAAAPTSGRRFLSTITARLNAGANSDRLKAHQELDLLSNANLRPAQGGGLERGDAADIRQRNGTFQAPFRQWMIWSAEHAASRL
jgi:hypothetical protein